MDCVVHPSGHTKVWSCDPIPNAEASQPVDVICRQPGVRAVDVVDTGNEERDRKLEMCPMYLRIVLCLHVDRTGDSVQF